MSIDYPCLWTNYSHLTTGRQEHNDIFYLKVNSLTTQLSTAWQSKCIMMASHQDHHAVLVRSPKMYRNFYFRERFVLPILMIYIDYIHLYH